MNPYNQPDIEGSHQGEDDWILAQFPEDFKGVAVELGALDGLYMSNTLLLEQRGWTVLCIEPYTIHHEKLKASRKLVLTCACAEHPEAEPQMLFHHPKFHMQTCAGLDPVAAQKIVPPGVVELCPVQVRTVDQCLDQIGATRLDCISIDVDGIDFGVLKGANIPRWQPRVVVIEFSEDTDLETRRYLGALGYALIDTIGHNSCFLKS